VDSEDLPRRDPHSRGAIANVFILQLVITAIVGGITGLKIEKREQGRAVLTLIWLYAYTVSRLAWAPFRRPSALEFGSGWKALWQVALLSIHYLATIGVLEGLIVIGVDLFKSFCGQPISLSLVRWFKLNVFVWLAMGLVIFFLNLFLSIMGNQPFYNWLMIVRLHWARFELG
jgi:hypothetical protein